MLIAGILGIWMAVLTKDPEVTTMLVPSLFTLNPNETILIQKEIKTFTASLKRSQ